MEIPVQLSKKVLIVSSWAPPQVSGSAHLLYNLFSHFDSDNYCMYTSKRNFGSDKENNRRILSGKYFFFEDNPIFKIPLFPFTYTKTTSIFTKVYQKIRRGILKTGRAYTMVKTGLKIMKQEKIEILVGTSDMGPCLLLTFALSKLSRKPYVLVLFDLYRENDFSPVWKTTARTMERILFKNAVAVTTITEEIQNHYIKRYGEPTKYHVISQCIAESHYQNINTSIQHGENKTIVFTGSIYWAQQKSLLGIVSAINTLPRNTVEFKIYTPRISGELQKLVTENNNTGRTKILSVAPDKIPSIQCEADILLLPLSWDTPSMDVITRAVPFKLIEYMAAKKPILIYAPPESAVSRYAQKEGFAHTIDKENINLLQEGIEKILSDGQYASKLINAGQKTFNENHKSSHSMLKLKAIIEHASV